MSVGNAKTLRVEIRGTVIEADLDLDFFVCPTHGVLMPGRFDLDWTTDDDCPVEGCRERVQAIYMSSLFGPSLERFMEAVLSEENINRAARKRFNDHAELCMLPDDPRWSDVGDGEQEELAEEVRIAVEAALSKAQELMEEGHDGR